MNFAYSEEQEELRRTVRAFLEQMRDAKGVSMAASGGAASGAGRIVSAR